MARGDKLALDDILTLFPFKLDKFQQQALVAFLSGSSVIVSAPTGAGKTAIAEAATIAVLSR